MKSCHTNFLTQNFGISFCTSSHKPRHLSYFMYMCVGISRMQRWERAALHGLNPPQEIKDILLKESTDPDYTHRCYEQYP